MTHLDSLDLSHNLLQALPIEFTQIFESIPTVNLLDNPWDLLPPRWGRRYLDKATVDEPMGYRLHDAVDFLYGMSLFYDTAEKIWQETGIFHYTLRLNLEDFLTELRRRIPKTWHEGLVEHAKHVYFQVCNLYNIFIE